MNFFTLLGYSILVLKSTSAKYVETGECIDKSACSYSYEAQQDYADSDEESQHTEINATVEITCVSGGLYESQNATFWCMRIKNAEVSSSLFNNSEAKERSFHRRSLTEQLSHWFCFVQSSDGKIPVVYHSPGDVEDVVNFKKAIAAAFQTNFQGTSEEEEVDPISKHTSHYTTASIIVHNKVVIKLGALIFLFVWLYLKTNEEKNLIKIKRSIHDSDVREYSSDSKHSNIKSTEEEEMDYENGRLKKSLGHIVLQMVNDSKEAESNEEMADGPSLSQTFSANGKYQISQLHCIKLSTATFNSFKEMIDSRMQHSVEQDLKANHNTREQAYEEMKDLRKRLGLSVKQALQNYKSFNGKLQGFLVELIDLESKHGTISLQYNALDEVVLYMNNEYFKNDHKLRELVYEVLSVESSFKAQMALLGALDSTRDEMEANDILVHISFLSSVNIEFILGLEERLTNTSLSTSLQHQLLLVYGSLAMKGKKEVEFRVMDELIGRCIDYHNSSTNFSSTVILIALGNTGSKLSVTPIISFLGNSSENQDVDVPLAINALFKVTDNSVVLSKLEELVRGHNSFSLMTAVIEALHNGLDFVKESDRNVEKYLSIIKSRSLLAAVASAVSMHNDSELYKQAVEYFSEIKVSQEVLELLHSTRASLVRQKRYTIHTRDWDSSHPDYNYIASRASRANDEVTYPRHYAFLTSKRLGISDVHLKIISGLFAGISSHCDRMKTFGRIHARSRVLTSERTLADAKLELRLTTTTANFVAYVRFGSNTLLNVHESKSISKCWKKTKNLINYRQLLFSIRFRIFVYVGTLKLYIRLYFQFNLNLNSNMCIGRTGTEVSGALGAISPSAGLTVEGGVTGNLLGVARGGISASVSINYRLEPAASIQTCTARCSLSTRMCIGVYDSIPNSYISIETWYQTRKVGRCKRRWIKYPCIKWGRRRKWSALSHTWIIGRTYRRPVWQQCRGNLYSDCAAGALSSPLFSY